MPNPSEAELGVICYSLLVNGLIFRSWVTSVHERDIIKICHLFYKEGISQVEIGAMMGLSRWKVGRAIKDARERELISISINHPQSDLTESEIALAKRYDLKEAIVVDINEFDRVSPLDQLGAAGARYLTSIIEHHRILGVTWGSTVSYVAKNLSKVEAKHLKTGSDRRRTWNDRGDRQSGINRNAGPETGSRGSCHTGTHYCPK